MLKGASEVELRKFQQLVNHWHDPNGALRSLHLFNPIRVGYINDMVRRYGRRVAATGDQSSGNFDYLLRSGANGGQAGYSAFLANTSGGSKLRVLDVGCGGGILSESLFRLGASVTGIDLVQESVAVANERKGMVLANLNQSSPLYREEDLTFRQASLFEVLEEESKADGGYDVVVASEVVEHVDDARAFVKALGDVTKARGGLLIVSTMEKSICSFLSHIVVAETLTGIVAPGTHDWGKFINKKDLSEYLAQHNHIAEVDHKYIASLPDPFQSAATRNLQLQFKLTNAVNTGHYLWTGLKQ
uniref:2-polyprenyl-6-hydroxyphenyl methylase/3-demethylubiquinone-9 3-methyltransferase n=1 Tax=Angomonas deanei TaxID=59799 RepID=T1YT17_9TRYP|nr:2-polyprenyl-6-hydroxyphenyl methylase/3-demethylubiquinone-9 3-methyltransferase [Angomonas deanei]